MRAKQEQEKYVVRLPTGMRETIRQEAARQCRSMNAEIIYRLSQAYSTPETQKADARA